MIKEQDKNIYKPFLDAVNYAIDGVISDQNKKPVFLDAGCGHSSTLSEEYKRCTSIIGVDLDKEGLSKNELVNRKIYADLIDIPLADQSVDIISSAWVLEHISQPEKFVKECSRLIKLNGYFVFIAPNRSSVTGIFNRLAPGFMHKKLVRLLYGRDEEDTFPTVYHLNTEKDLDRLMILSGFKKVRFVYNDDVLFFGFNFLTRPFARLWHKIVMTKGFKKMRANIIGVYKKND